jgi:hypothetical protein
MRAAFRSILPQMKCFSFGRKWIGFYASHSFNPACSADLQVCVVTGDTFLAMMESTALCHLPVGTIL